MIKENFQLIMFEQSHSDCMTCGLKKDFFLYKLVKKWQIGGKKSNESEKIPRIVWERAWDNKIVKEHALFNWKC